MLGSQSAARGRPPWCYCGHVARPRRAGPEVRLEGLSRFRCLVVTVDRLLVLRGLGDDDVVLGRGGRRDAVVGCGGRIGGARCGARQHDEARQDHGRFDRSASHGAPPARRAVRHARRKRWRFSQAAFRTRSLGENQSPSSAIVEKQRTRPIAARVWRARLRRAAAPTERRPPACRRRSAGGRDADLRAQLPAAPHHRPRGEREPERRGARHRGGVPE